MNPLLKILSFIAALVMLAGCNLPLSQGASSGLTTEQQAATLVAATLGARGSQPPGSVTPFASPNPPAATASAGPTMQITAATADCRRGPGPNFANITSLAAGANLEVIGQNPENNYWQVKVPNSTDTCWVSGTDGKVNGNTASLPEATAEASNPNLPAGPQALFYSFTCPFPAGGQQQITVDLTWSDRADNETGYHVYRDGTQIADLPANSTSYADTTAIAPGAVLTYQVAAYNNAGSSPQAVTRNGDPITCH